MVITFFCHFFPFTVISKEWKWKKKTNYHAGVWVFFEKITVMHMSNNISFVKHNIEKIGHIAVLIVSVSSSMLKLVTITLMDDSGLVFNTEKVSHI